MGLANLVPGISGGTMLLASGIYPRFIGAIAELSTLKFRLASIAVLGVVVAAAGAGILLLAGPVKDLVVDHRWAMYSLFIGLTLGGVPILRTMLGVPTRSVWMGAGAGFVGMALLALVQAQGTGGSETAEAGKVLLFLAGVAGASAMILPGVSGGYLLLVLGVYVPILSAIERLKSGLEGRDWALVTDVGLGVCVPVGLGVVVGIVAVSNVLKLLLQRFEKATLGVLLGLLLGAVVGLWPFQQAVEPELGSRLKGQVVSAENLAEFEREDWPTAYFRPSVGQAAGALVLVAVGFGLTLAVSRLGAERGAVGNKDER